MSSFPCLVRFVSGSGQVRYRLGDRLVDRYLEFVAGPVPVMSAGNRGEGVFAAARTASGLRAWWTVALHPGCESGFYPAADVPVLWRRDDGYRPVQGMAGGE